MNFDTENQAETESVPPDKIQTPKAETSIPDDEDHQTATDQPGLLFMS